MKLLTLVRHAQAEDLHSGISDFERSLTEIGKLQSKAAGLFLKDNLLIPDLILSSPARRTIETAEIIADFFSSLKGQIITDPVIYNGNENSVLELICNTSNTINHLLICGHNPTMLELSNVICYKKRNHFKKGYVLVLLIKIKDWIELFNSNGEEKNSFEPNF